MRAITTMMKRRRLTTAGLAFCVIAMATTPLPAQDSPRLRITDKGILLDFQDVDLRIVIGALAQAAGLNVLYNELPQRHTTLRMQQPLPKELVPELLRSLARSNGLRMVEDSGFVRFETLTTVDARPGNRPDSAPVEPQEIRLFVYRLKHAQAQKIGSTLQSIFGGVRPTGVPNAPSGARPSGLGISQVPLSQGLRAQQLAATNPDQPARVAVEVGQTNPSIPGQLRGEVQIVPDEATNSLVVRAMPSDWEVVRQAVAALDLRPLQVLIEVVIAEVRRSTEFDVSVAGSYTNKPKSGGLQTGQLGADSISGGVVLGFLKQSGNATLSLALSALASHGDVRILSRPVVFAQNNQEAHILIGSERPFVQVSRSLPVGVAVQDQIVQYRDVGTKLTILPTINPEGYVNLQLSQEVSNATNETQFGAPVISTREEATRIFIKNGQTAVVGGLIEHEQDRNRSGIPYLSSIPVIGGLFGSTQKSTASSELFVFLTPHIVETDEDMERIRRGVEEGPPQLNRELPRDRTIVPGKPDSTRPPAKPPGTFK